jgi:hypothetical protein
MSLSERIKSCWKGLAYVSECVLGESLEINLLQNKKLKETRLELEQSWVNLAERVLEACVKITCVEHQFYGPYSWSDRGFVVIALSVDLYLISTCGTAYFMSCSVRLYSKAILRISVSRSPLTKVVRTLALAKERTMSQRVAKMTL